MKKQFLFLLFIFFFLQVASGVQHWAKKAGGNGVDQSFAITSDSSSVFVAGVFFDIARFGEIEIPGTLHNSNDAFLAAYNKEGVAVWARHIGGGSVAEAHAIGSYQSNLYVGGWFQDSLLNANGVIHSNGGKDLFLSSFDKEGNYRWTFTAGGIGNDEVTSACTDSSGNVYVTGYFSDTIQLGGTDYYSAGRRDVFVACLDSLGNFLWAVTAGGAENDQGNAIAYLTGGDIVVSGSFTDSANFGNLPVVSLGSSDVFVTRLNGSGSYQWIQTGGGVGADVSTSVAINSFSEICMTGTVTSGGTIVFGLNLLTGAGGTDLFYARYDANGNILQNLLSGSAADEMVWNISISENDEMFISGSFMDSTILNGTTSYSAGGLDAFVLRTDSVFTPRDLRIFGGLLDDESYGAAPSHEGTAFLTGYFNRNCMFEKTSMSGSNSDAFLVTFENEIVDEPGTATSHFHTGNSNIPSNNISDIVLDHGGNAWVATRDSGVAVYQSGTWTRYSTLNSGIQSNHVNSIYIDSADVKWFATSDSGIISFDGNAFISYNLSNSTLTTNSINAITGFHGNPSVWTGTNDNGCIRLNIAMNIATVFDSINSLAPSNTITCMSSDSAGTFWMGTGDNGVGHFQNGVITPYDTINSDLADNRINNLFCDASGVMWFATDGGISYFDGTNFTSFTPSTGEITDKFNDVFADPNGAVAKASKKKGTVVSGGIVQRNINTSNSLFDNNVTTITSETMSRAGERTYWMGTEHNGVFMYVDSNAANYVELNSDKTFIGAFPNPAGSFVRVDFNSSGGSAVLSVHSIEGKVLDRIILSDLAPGANSRMVNLKGLESGIYVIALKDLQGIHTRKIVHIADHRE